MKKVSILAALLLLAGTLSAQVVQLGARVGVFSQDMEMKFGENPNNILTDSKLGFNAAIVTRVRLVAIGHGAVGLGLYLQPEVLYSQNTYKIKTDNDSPAAKIKMQSVDIPVMLSFKVSIVRVQAGPVFNVMQKSPSNQHNVELMMLKPTVGYTLGASIDIFGGLVLDGRYNGQFKELKNNLNVEDMNFSESVRSSLSSWSLGLSWLF